MKNRNRKYWIFGIIGCVLFGVGDWLLGYVDPAAVAEDFSVIKAGHGAGQNGAQKIVAPVYAAALDGTAVRAEIHRPCDAVYERN